MVLEYTQGYAEMTQDEELVLCHLCTAKRKISFSPFQKQLRRTTFYPELLQIKEQAPFLYQTGRILVFLYKNRAFQRISLLETVDLLQLLVDKCRELKIKRLLLPIKTFLIEGIAVENVLSALHRIDSEGVELYYF